MLETRGFYKIDDSRLEYQLLSPAHHSELTLVCLHEGLGCLAMWKDFPRQLAEATRCRVLSYSRAGYGGSTPCALPRPLNFMQFEGLTVLPGILAAAGVQEAILVGHSDGASIALISAGGLTDKRIKGLILMAPHVFVEELTLASIHAARTAYLKTDLRNRLRHYHGENVDCAFWGWNQVWLDPDFLDWTLVGYLPEIEVPVLLIQGEDDNYGTLEQLAAISQNLPCDSVQIVLPACGHSPFRDQPLATLQAIKNFLLNSFRG